MNDNASVMVVTGANTGLGFALVRQLCRQFGPKAIVYLTARHEERGLNAVQQLRQEGLDPVFHLLDVSEPSSVEAFAYYLEQTHHGVDVVISNAAARISPDRSQADQVKNFIQANNHGTYHILQAFRPLLKDNARLVVVASSFGSLRHLNPALHAKFDVEHVSLEDIEQTMEVYGEDVVHQRAAQIGWPDWINIPSKIGQVASMKIFARSMAQEAATRGILINAACPGLVNTEASRPWFKDMSSAQSPEEAAVDVAWLATLPLGTTAPYGELVQHRTLIPWR
jgi:NAD(P)-dependent dehydrogenase (short-subunit alcohol dehydrogenase family)